MKRLYLSFDRLWIFSVYIHKCHRSEISFFFNEVCLSPQPALEELWTAVHSDGQRMEVGLQIFAPTSWFYSWALCQFSLQAAAASTLCQPHAISSLVKSIIRTSSYVRIITLKNRWCLALIQDWFESTEYCPDSLNKTDLSILYFDTVSMNNSTVSCISFIDVSVYIRKH